MNQAVDGKLNLVVEMDACGRNAIRFGQFRKVRASIQENCGEVVIPSDPLVFPYHTQTVVGKYDRLDRDIMLTFGGQLHKAHLEGAIAAYRHGGPFGAGGLCADCTGEGITHCTHAAGGQETSFFD